MKRLLLILFSCLILSTVSFAQEQTDTTNAAPAVAVPAKADTTRAAVPAPESESLPAEWNVVAFGGWTFPFEPEEFDQAYKASYNVGGGFAYLLSPGDVGYGELSVLFHYYNALFDSSGYKEANNVSANTQVSGSSARIYTAMAQFRGVYGKRNQGIAPYFTAAFGLYSIDLPAIGIEGQTTLLQEGYMKTVVGWSAGLGVDCAVTGSLTLFVDGNFILGVTETNGHKMFSAGGGLRYKL